MEEIAAKRSKVVEKNNTGDLISSLPDHLLHQIMSLLPPRYAAATSVLSHRWETIWLSFPIIDLDQSYFSNGEKLCSCLKSTLTRHNLSNLQAVRLRFNLSCSPQINHCVCEFMNIVLPDSKILKELDIRMTNYLLSSEQDICVPQIICIRPKEILSSCLNLISLRIEGCRFEGSPHVDLPKLKTLHLKNMFVHEEFLVELIHACPIIDTLSVEYCIGIANIRICHPIIENLALGFQNDLKTLELNMPRAKSISFHTLANSVTKEGILKVLGHQNSKKILAQNLETLYLECLVIEPDVLHNIISIFPKMEKLYMSFCDVLGQALLNSKTLMNLEMNECVFLDEVDIRTPNLQNFEYVHNPEGVQLNYEMLMYIRQLSLGSIELGHETLWINSSNFPALVFLKLGYCSDMKELRIISKKLESLEVLGCENLEHCLIIAPQLLSFTYSGKVVDMASIEASRKLCVTLNLEDVDSDHDHVRYVNKFVGFLQKVDAAAACMTIEMDYSCTECLMMIKDIHVPPTTLLQHLKFDTWPGVMSLRDLMSCLLCISIHCNNLSINLGWFLLTLEFQEIKKKEACFPKTNLAHIENHLVRIEMKHFTGSADEVDMVEFLVEKARLLQHMTIWMKKGKEDEATQICLEACHGKLHLFNIDSHGGYVSLSRNAI